jgi:hypothetical protein
MIKESWILTGTGLFLTAENMRSKLDRREHEKQTGPQRVSADIHNLRFRLHKSLTFIGALFFTLPVVSFTKRSGNLATQTVKSGVEKSLRMPSKKATIHKLASSKISQLRFHLYQ